MIITRLIKYIMAAVSNTAKSTINTNYKIIMEVFVEVYFKVIAKRNAIFIRSQITN